MNTVLELPTGEKLNAGVGNILPWVAFLGQYCFDISRLAELTAAAGEPIKENAYNNYYEIPVFTSAYANRLASDMQDHMREKTSGLVSLLELSHSDREYQLIDNLETQAASDWIRRRYMEESGVTVDVNVYLDDVNGGVIFATQSLQVDADNWFVFVYEVMKHGLQHPLVPDKHKLEMAVSQLFTSPRALYADARESIRNRTGGTLDIPNLYINED